MLMGQTVKLSRDMSNGINIVSCNISFVFNCKLAVPYLVVCGVVSVNVESIFNCYFIDWKS